MSCPRGGVWIVLVAIGHCHVAMASAAPSNPVTVATTPAPHYCTDRYGPLPVDRFLFRSCTLCYTYLFLKKKELATRIPFETLHYKNASVAESITPDPRNETSMAQVCLTLTSDDCQRWRACCNEAVTCCAEQNSSPRPPHDDHTMCPRTWDGFHCWGDTAAGMTKSTPCPTFLGTGHASRNARKECTTNGTWVTNQGLEWTDYTTCVDMQGFLINVYICVACNSASILLLLPSIVIFLVFRDLSRQHRVRLHINFFLVLLLRCVAEILWFLLVHHDKLTNTDVSEAVLIQNPVWCRVLSFFKIYLHSATYAWMFCEGYYLHRLISRAFEPPKSLVTLYVIGWVLPMIPSVVYAILRVYSNNDSCWVYHIGHSEWLLYAPNLLCIVLNIAFLCNILRILLFQLHSHPHEPSSFRRGLKAAFMLIPLFGIQLILTIYRPSTNMEGGLKAYEYTTTIVIDSQGLFVALIFCFFNGEVLAHFHDCCCPCGRRCLKRFIRRRSPSSHMTQVTFTDNGRSLSIHSHSSISPKRSGVRLASTNGYLDVDLRDMAPSTQQNSLTNKPANGSNVTYAPLPTVALDLPSGTDT